jgi:ketosteroid isomerase-like protein
VSIRNVELHHQAHDAFNRRDLAGFLSLTSPDVEFTPYEVAVQGGEPYRGHDGVEGDGRFFCCAHCATASGVTGVADRAG